MNEILQGDSLAVLKTLPAGSVDCVVTSPPYYGLRDYGATGQVGLEDTPAEFVANLVAIFSECHRVLKKEGTLWLNLGDSYAGSGRGRDGDGTWNPGRGDSEQQTNKGSITGDVRPSFRRDRAPVSPRKVHRSKNLIENGAIGNAWVKPPAGFKAKDLIGIPWRVAFALQEAGWYLRQDIIWSKPNPMPESVTDRCTKAHEYIFLLSKSREYYYDHEAIKEPAIYGGSEERVARASLQHKSAPTNKINGIRPRADARAGKGRIAYEGKRTLDTSGKNGQESFVSIAENRNKRSVWTITTKPFKGAHFATFPEDLIEPMVLAGCPRGGVVLDPFMGAGTTAVVAQRHGRNWLGIELNPEYIKIANERIGGSPVPFPDLV